MTDPLTPEEAAAGARNARIGTELVLDWPGLSVWQVRLVPGETLPAHRHDRPYFWSALTDGEAVARYGDGRVVERVYRSGDTRHFSELGAEDAFIHDLTNVGPAELAFVTVEFDPLPRHDDLAAPDAGSGL